MATGLAKPVGWLGRQLDDPQVARAGGRLSAMLFVLCGALVVTLSPLPTGPGGNRALLVVVGLTAGVGGVVIWVLPWQRWPRTMSLWSLVPTAFLLIDLHNLGAGQDGFRYPVFFLVVFVWVGLAHPRGASIAIAPALALAYIGPLVLVGRPSAVAIWSFAYVGPVSIVVGETVAYVAERMRRSERAVRTSEQRWRSLVLNASDMVVVLDAAAHIQYASPAVGRLFGYDVEALAGSNVLELIHPDDIGFVVERLSLSLQRPGPGEHIEFRVRRDDATYGWVESIGTNLLEEPTVEGIVCNVRDITERKQAEAEIVHQARHDALTGLPNRIVLTAELDGRIAGGDDFAVLLVDIDRFRDINDGLGHHVGDQLLLEMAGRLQATCRPADLVTHLGADEFAVVIGGVASAEETARVAARVASWIAAGVELDGVFLHVSTSIGAVFAGGGEDSSGAVLQRADVALRRAKTAAAPWAVYGPEDHLDRPAQLALLADLRRAIDDGQLDLHFQPQVELASGAVVQVEALVRWNRMGSPVAPDRFIPLAEQTGLIGPLTDWVLRRALKQCRLWLDEDIAVAVSVNLSPSSLRDQNLVNTISTALIEARVPAQFLTLELTETALAEQTTTALTILSQLRRLGVRLSIDDFGSGYSSMAYLKRLPVHELKIDRSFVMDMGTDDRDRQITRTLIDLAHSLGLSVVAEGVETEEVCGLLAGYDCDSVQGFGLCRPLAGVELTGWLALRRDELLAGSHAGPAESDGLARGRVGGPPSCNR